MLDRIIHSCYNAIKRVFRCCGGGIIRKLTYKQKLWLDKKSRKELKRRTKTNHKPQNRYPSEYKKALKNVGYFVAPRVFSLVRNPSETIKYFDNIVNEIKKNKFNEIIYLDLAQVEDITTESVMYVIALIENIRSVKTFRIKLCGSWPKDQKARKILEQSGFWQYVNCEKIHMETDSSKIQITSGYRADREIAQRMCDFVNRIWRTDTKQTKQLYPLIMELMFNTQQHAYKEQGCYMDKKWYISAEDIGEEIRFTFLDTGLGIPNTIYKKWHEKFDKLWFLGKTHADYIESAFNGEFRSETKQDYRSRGLPSVYTACVESHIYDLMVVSSSGQCLVHQPPIIEKQEFDTPIFGTLFCWSLKKPSIK